MAPTHFGRGSRLALDRRIRLEEATQKETTPFSHSNETFGSPVDPGDPVNQQVSPRTISFRTFHWLKSTGTKRQSMSSSERYQQGKMKHIPKQNGWVLFGYGKVSWQALSGRISRKARKTARKTLALLLKELTPSAGDIPNGMRFSF